MATQSLYRRYRPRRFSELKGQDHVVKALRDAVAQGREGQAYLFSGPRGTGKTTSARILAKVLNCQNVVDGEPCCECESCLAVERGTSYDVHELDAASNNGVDAIRDLVEKASLGTPGRHKVYILDEVHMLSKAAEAALLKTLEEPPPHVVFVLATTDPQKMSDTIRSRTQHLQFHLLPADTMAEHVHWVAGDAGLDLSQAALDAALVQGGGSARDTLSALELLVSTGGDVDEVVDLDEFMAALIEHDPGRILTAMAHAVSLGRDPRTVTEELVRHLRNAFLSLMAPELVMLPSDQLDAIAAAGAAVGRGRPGAGDRAARVGDGRDAPGARPTDPGRGRPRAAHQRRGRHRHRRPAGTDRAAREHRQATPRGGARRLARRRSGAARPHHRPGRARRGGAGQAGPGARAHSRRAGRARRNRGGAGGRSRPGDVGARGVGADRQGPGQADRAGALLGRVVRRQQRRHVAVQRAQRGPRRQVRRAPAGGRGGARQGGRVAGHHRVRGRRPGQRRRATRASGAEAIPEGTGFGHRRLRRRPVPTPATIRHPLPDTPAADDEIDLSELTDAPPETVKTPLDRLAEAFPGSEFVSEA